MITATGKAGNLLILVLLAAALSSCSNTKHIASPDSLYVGAKVKITDKVATSKEQKLLVKDIVPLVRPKPNNTTLGMRIKLRLYEFAGNPKKQHGIKAWLHNKVGEPPVLASTLSLAANKVLIENHLQNRGFFYATVKGHTVTRHKKTTAVFDINTGPQYIIRNTRFMKDSSQISADIDSDFTETLITHNAPYNLDLIKAERSRIDRALKEKGYYFFKPDYLMAVADTGIGSSTIDMGIKLKRREIPPEAYRIYKIGDIYIFPNFKLQGKQQDTSKANAVLYKGYNIVDPKKKFNPEIFYRAITVEKGDEYSLDDQNTTLSRLVNMGTFKFVKNRYDPINDTMLDVYYYLTPYPKKSLRFQVGVLTENDNGLGSNASISLKNRNTFKGAEELLMKINGGFEKQYSGGIKQPTIYNLGAEVDLSFPRFVVPFFNIYTSSLALPRSFIKLSYNYETQAQLLRISSYKASYGYDWKQGKRIEHQFYPFNLTYVKTDTLATSDKLKLLYANLIFDGIIIGPTYEFTYNTQTSGVTHKNDVYFDGLIDLSANVLGVAQGADYAKDPKTIFGSRYAQYAKLQPDFRFYHRISSATSLATRALIGLGIPYGNSSQLPNIKQFWAGGNSDLRGFPSRLLGPGTFNEYYLNKSSTYIETLGDMKLEFNAEIRQNIYKFFKIALFADAGNIWLYRPNEAFPGGTFSNQFYKELAADVGLGFRFDFTILILRLDLGMPVREPWLAENDRWVFNRISFSDPSWRKDNLVLNIGIGYPF